MSLQTNFPFGKESNSYKVGVVETPFKKKGQEFDFSFGNYIRLAYYWRLGCFSYLLISSILMVILLFSLNTSPYKIFTISLNEQGMITQSGILQDEYMISKNSYQNILGTMLNGLLVQGQKPGAVSFVSEGAAESINRFITTYKINSPFRIINFDIKNGGSFIATISVGNKMISVIGDFDKSIFINAKLIKSNPYGLYLKKIIFSFKSNQKSNVS